MCEARYRRTTHTSAILYGSTTRKVYAAVLRAPCKKLFGRACVSVCNKKLAHLGLHRSDAMRLPCICTPRFRKVPCNNLQRHGESTIAGRRDRREQGEQGKLCRFRRCQGCSLTFHRAEQCPRKWWLRLQSLYHHFL